MTVLVEDSSAVYTGIVDGVPLNVAFPVQEADELKVRYGDDDTLATEGVDYSVALVPPDYLTATVTPLTGFAVTSGGTVSVRREVPYTQPTDIPTLAKIASSRLEQICDRIVFIAQQLRDGLSYSLKFPTTDLAANIGAMPLAADRALKYLTFDADGKPVASEAPVAMTTPFTAFGIAWVNLANAAAGLTNLGAVAKAGDTMAGALTLSGAPTVDLHASTKKYVDDAIAALLASSTALTTAAQVPIGVPIPFMGNVAACPANYLFVNGKTIGNALSGGTALASADAETLFTLWWNATTNTEAPVSTGRGANAGADFAAGKTITLLDLKGRVVAGHDSMGGTASANRLTVAGGGVDGDILGTVGGVESHVLTTAQMPSHTHGGTGGYSFIGDGGGTWDTGGGGGGNVISITPTGGDLAHPNVQPVAVLPMIVRYK